MRQTGIFDWQNRSKSQDKKRQRKTKIQVAKAMRYMSPKTLIKMDPKGPESGKKYLRDLHSKMMQRYRYK
jgi:hypothetical protein